MAGSRTSRELIALVAVIGIVVAACGDGGTETETTDTAEATETTQATEATGTTSDDGNGASSGEIFIGLLNPATGPFAALGEDTNAGFELFIAEQGGTLGGYEVELRKEDEANDVAIATTAARQLVDAGVDIVVGLANSGVAYGVMEYLSTTEVPVLDTLAGADGLTQGDGGERFFRVSYSSSQDNFPLGDYACTELGYETTVLVALDYAFGWEASGGFARAYEDAGCEIIQEIYSPIGTEDWGPFVQEINTSADAIYVIAPGGDGIRFLQAYRDFGVALPVLAGGSTVDEQLLPTQQQAAEGVISSLHWSPLLDTPENQAFCESFLEAYDRPCNQYAENGYTGAMALATALESLEGELTHDSLTEALRGVQIEGAPRGPMYFDDYGQAVYNVYIRDVQNVDGQWQNVVIDTYEEVSQFWTYGADTVVNEFEPYDQLVNTWSN